MTKRLAPQFGISVTPNVNNLERIVSIAQLLDRSGIDFMTSQDHPYNPGFLDAWSLLTIIAAKTEHLRILPNVLSLPLRPPAMLAKSAATLDILTHGRVELGLGSGISAEGAYSFGGTPRTRGESVSALEEGIKVIKTFWQSTVAGDHVTFNGTYYHLNEALPGPPPVHPIGVWVGTYSPRSLRITGRLADGWLPSSPYLPPKRALIAQAMINEAAQKAGRQPTEIRRGYNLAGMVVPLVSPIRGRKIGIIVSSAKEWVKTLSHYYYDLGFDTFIFWSIRDEEKQIRRFVEDVVPAARAALQP
jgi:alkanesulfonate monooxygenase SsuD/methylene tetrahydromethanopterin reductase-like flavin-dependent oxidoreductase (luciferase family)